MRTKKTLVPLAIEGIHGREWYRQAGGQIDKVCRLAEWSPERFAAILGVTSPRVHVIRNIRYALQYMRTGTLPDDCMRTIRAAVDHYEKTGRIRGPKTSAFAAALLGDPDAVVLDVWMAHALRVPQESFRLVPVRREAEKRIRATARAIGETPAATQAALWTGQRARSGYSFSGFPVWEEYNKIF